MSGNFFMGLMGYGAKERVEKTRDRKVYRRHNYSRINRLADNRTS